MINLQEVISRIDSEQSEECAHEPSASRIELSGENAAAGLGRLAVAIINLLHELLERQAIRRMENETISEDQAELLGKSLMLQSEAIDELCASFGITRADLNLDLGPLGKLV